ncbi:DUF4177 domain-containing protein [bacterium]|nr:DUF4177 domain-containing protein [bacterium]
MEVNAHTTGFFGGVHLSGGPVNRPPKAVQYEYKFLSLSHGSAQQDEEQLNKLAAEGWEVVIGTTQSRTASASPPRDSRLVLKRANP